MLRYISYRENQFYRNFRLNSEFWFLWESFDQMLTFCSFRLIQVRILNSLFPPLILELYKLLIAPIAQGKLAALMVGEFC